jgi:CspA family cold shock protein
MAMPALDVEQAAPKRLRGRVKWFDPAKGFGFILIEDGGPDVLLHANVLRNFGQSSVADEADVEVVVQHTARGRQAVQVLSIEPPKTVTNSSLSDLAEVDPEVLSSLPLVPARIKWFDKAKGFGFANIFGSAADVFVHIEVVRRSGFADLQPGEAVSLKVMQGKRGRLALMIAPWDAAPKFGSK